MIAENDLRPGGADTPRDDVSPYLTRIAAALADADATVERVLAAAGPRSGEHWSSQANFTPAVPGFTWGTVMIGDPGTEDDRPSSVLLRCADAEPVVRLHDLEQVFGGWRNTVPGPGLFRAHPVAFTSKYRAGHALPAGGSAVFVSALLAGRPGLPSTHVREVRLRRDSDRE